MAPPGDSETFFKAEGGRGQQSLNDSIKAIKALKDL